MALKKVKGNLERLFDKSLTDLVRGLRNNKESEGRYVSQCMEEIKLELKQDNAAVKANAIAKLSYLQMLGYDISWASFNIIEVMSSTKFTHKRIGYLAAAQCFNENTDVLMLTTNMIRKDLNSQNMYDAGTALTGISCFITADLARDLANDVVTLLTSSRPYIRKKAVLLLYKVFLNYPDALRPTFPRLKEKLEDPDTGVQSAAVNVICELARKNPKNFLSLAPVFFKLMTSSSNNWMLIKIIKLFGALTPLEPRLGKKLIEPLTNLINSTSAMSLLYECINTVIAVLISVSAGAPGDHSASIQLCVQKLSVLIEDTDQNLKYLGLLAMGKILQTHPKAVQAHKDLILNCLDDRDESIRLRALDLLYGMVSKKNIVEIVKKLMVHVEKAEGSTYRDELLAKIIQICSHNNYQYVTNFEWYVSVLVELTKVEGTKHGELIAQQMLDVAVRVQSIRHFAVSQMALLIENSHLLLGSLQRSNICEVLYAAVWICGEYSEHLRNKQAVLEAMLRTKVVVVPGHIQSIFVQNIGKLYGQLVTEAETDNDWDRVASLDNLLISKLPQFELSENIEVQERACSLIQLSKEIERLHKANEKVGEDYETLFQGELNPIAPKAQKKVPVPDGLDLDAWINEPPSPEVSEGSDDEMEKQANLFVPMSQQAAIQERLQKRYEPTEDELQRMRDVRQAEHASNPYILKGATRRPNEMKLPKGTSMDSSAADEVPIDLQTPLEIPGMVDLKKYMEQQEQTLSWKSVKEKRKGKKSKKKKGRAASGSSEDEHVPVVHEVYRDAGEMPEGAKSTDEDESNAKSGDQYKALDINLDEPLKDTERLPVRRHHMPSPVKEVAKQTEATPEDAGKAKKVEKGTKKLKKKKAKDDEQQHTTVDETKSKKKRILKKLKEAGKEDSSNNLLVVENDVEPSPLVTEVPSASLLDVSPEAPNHVGGETAAKSADAHDIDFWLSMSDNSVPSTAQREGVPVSADAPESLTASVEGPSDKTEERRVKKVKDSKKSTTAGTAGKREKKKGKTVKSAPNRSEYEEASGVCTPSKEHSNPETPRQQNASPASLPEMQRYRLLTENAHVRMTFCTESSLTEPNRVCVSVVFANLTQGELRQLDFNLLDSLNCKLSKQSVTTSASGGVSIPFVLLPSASNEHRFTFTVDDISIPQKLRGTLFYMMKAESGFVQDKCDFSLKLPVTAFTVATTISNDAFTELLSGSEVSQKSYVKIATSEPFRAFLAQICFYGHFTIVESFDSSASLYAQTTQAQPVCLLVKQQAEVVNVDGRSTNAQLVSNILQELKEFLSAA